jgi:hypothetical protein
MTPTQFLILLATIYIAPHASCRSALIITITCLGVVAAIELGAFA